MSTLVYAHSSSKYLEEPKNAWAKQFTSVINKSKYQNQFRLETLTIKTISIRNRKEWEIKRSTTNIEREAVTEELKPGEGDDGGGRLEYERDEWHDAFFQKHRVRESQDDGDRDLRGNHVRQNQPLQCHLLLLLLLLDLSFAFFISVLFFYDLDSARDRHVSTP